MTESAAHDSYDEVPYPSHPMPQTHPDRLATMALLFGIAPRAVDRCRVLELGCADGGNLLGMAEALPGSEFVGVDLSAQHIRTGQAALEEIGLGNVTLRQMSILDVPGDWGLFDYIVCHGVYSWVPPQVQANILATVRRHLAPDGVAFVSYNTYPGWHLRGMVRAMMRYHARALPDPQRSTGRARDLLPYLLENLTVPESAYRDFLQEEHETLTRVRDTYVFHEHLEEWNAPVYFHEFVTRAEAHGLQYVADADLGAVGKGHLPAPLANFLNQVKGGWIEREQYYDFLSERRFRQSLLCHAQVPVRREPDPRAVLRLLISSQASCTSPEPDVLSDRALEFRMPSEVSASLRHPVSKAALVYLASQWPRCVPFADLAALARARVAGDAPVLLDPEEDGRETQVLAENLWQAALGGVVELHSHPLDVVIEPGECPRTTALARYQAPRGSVITTRRLEGVDLGPLSRRLLTHLDGRQDRNTLVDLLMRDVQEQNIPVVRHGRPVTDPARLRALLGRELEQNLERLARSALLVPLPGADA